MRQLLENCLVSKSWIMRRCMSNRCTAELTKIEKNCHRNFNWEVTSIVKSIPMKIWVNSMHNFIHIPIINEGKLHKRLYFSASFRQNVPRFTWDLPSKAKNTYMKLGLIACMNSCTFLWSKCTYKHMENKAFRINMVFKISEP